jgi:hypothetical protein
VDLSLLEEVVRRLDGEDAAILSSGVRAAIEELPRESLAHFTAPDPIPDTGGVQIHVLSPMPGTQVEIRHALAASSSLPSSLLRFRNRTSVVLWIRAWTRVMLLSGEAENDQYREMEAYFLRSHGSLAPYRREHAADWIKLSHHGADANNPHELFKRFGKRRFVASASAGGAYDHPHPNALKRAHFDHGGLVMCTNLGKGCRRILDNRVTFDPRSPEKWSRGLSTRRNPQVSCYRTITITVTDNGRMLTSTQSVQERCPYGGPVDGVVAL